MRVLVVFAKELLLDEIEGWFYEYSSEVIRKAIEMLLSREDVIVPYRVHATRIRIW